MLNDNIMENFNHRFPNHTGMFKVPIRGIESASPDFSDFKRALDDQHSYAESMADHYGTKQLPLPVMVERQRRYASVTRRPAAQCKIRR